MPKGNHGLSQFIIYADDPERAAAFYRAVFGWRISSLGPSPGLIIDKPGSGRVLRGHLAARKASESIQGFECIVSVTSLVKTAATVVANGGTVIEHVPFVKPVGGQLRFRDPEGNVVQAFQFAKPRPRFCRIRPTASRSNARSSSGTRPGDAFFW